MNEYSHYEDQELIALLQQGDAGAFTCIYDRYWERLFAIAYHFCRQKELSREIVQEIFMGLWDRKFIVDIQTLSAYLATATKYLVLRELRKENRRKRSRESHLSFEDVHLEEEEIDARFLRDYIRGQVEQMPEQCQIVYRYSREQHLSIPQIADILKISPKTAENHLTRALKALRLTLKTLRLWSCLMFVPLPAILLSTFFSST